MRVLVVEDELVSRKKLEKILSGVGKVEAVDSGAQAIRRFREARALEEPFDLVCLDINLPDMDGTMVLLELREAEKKMRAQGRKRTKIMMITSHRDKDTIITSIQAGCDEYLVKPFTGESVRQKLVKMGFQDE